MLWLIVSLYLTQATFDQRHGQWCEMTQARQDAVVKLHEHGGASIRVQR